MSRVSIGTIAVVGAVAGLLLSATDANAQFGFRTYRSGHNSHHSNSHHSGHHTSHYGGHHGGHVVQVPHTTTHTDYVRHGNHIDAVPHTTTHYDNVNVYRSHRPVVIYGGTNRHTSYYRRPTYSQPRYVHPHTSTHIDYVPHTTTHTDYVRHGNYIDAVPHTTTHLDAVPHTTTRFHYGP